MESQPTITVFAPTIQEAAKRIGVHQRTLKEWLADGAPEKTANGYDVDAIRSWRELNRKSTDDGDPTSEMFKLRMAMAKLKEQEGKADKVTAEAVIAEYKKLLLADDIVHLQDVKNWVALALTAFRNEIQQIPTQLAAGYAPKLQRQIERDCAERLDISLRALRTRLADIRSMQDDS